jgi:hypothetical protein
MRIRAKGTTRHIGAMTGLALTIAMLPSPAVADLNTVIEVEAKRVALVHYIWGTSWAEVLTRKPGVRSPYTPVAADALPSVSNVKWIEELVTTMSLPALTGGHRIEHRSTAYLYHPQSPNGRVVIVHHGHGCALNGSDAPYNLDKAIQDLVAANYTVVAMRMPLFERPSQCGSDAASKSHDDMFADPQRLKTGSPLQFFLEPIARALNYIQSKYPDTYHDFNMVGLSGGGWTATIYSALDPRITLSFPVAGSMPLDLPMGIGERDTEQNLPAFYALAGYRDLYIMGGFGPHRRQTQILNRKDNCCFVPPDQVAFNYACQVQSSLSALGAGAFVLDYDGTATTHQISLAALSSVILPTLAAGSAGAAPGSCSSRFSWPSGASVHLVNQHSGKCVQTSDADQGTVQQYPCHDGRNQIWILEGSGRIVSQNSGKCLDVPKTGSADSVRVRQTTCNGGTSQLWRATPRGEMINVNSGKCLDLPNGSVANGVELQQYSCNNGTNQQWIFP